MQRYSQQYENRFENNSRRGQQDEYDSESRASRENTRGGRSNRSSSQESRRGSYNQNSPNQNSRSPWRLTEENDQYRNNRNYQEEEEDSFRTSRFDRQSPERQTSGRYDLEQDRFRPSQLGNGTEYDEYSNDNFGGRSRRSRNDEDEMEQNWDQEYPRRQSPGRYRTQSGIY